MATSKKSSKKTARKAPKPIHRSFRVSREPAPFLSFYLTEQTIYWAFLLVMTLLLALWVLDTQLNTVRVLDSISLAM
ncbi:MAG: hypothetical protein WC790_03830 [Candidatus Paceibacterota bacterium]|jgi:hypothetical protein